MDVVVLFAPLIGALAAAGLRPYVGRLGSQLAATGAMGLAGILSILIFIEVAIQGQTRIIPLVSWVTSGGFDATWSLRIDVVTAVMLLVVTTISAAIHVYSIGYMSEESGVTRFFVYISLFTFFMLVLVTSDNFLQLYFGWEGVGLASYLLINFWYHQKASNDAAVKAFIVNRVGDFGFALGILAIFFVFGSIEFATVFGRAAEMADHTINFLSWDVDTLTVICLLLFIGAMGKSAQIGLHTWLPDAMEAPTPVSALIHAATMVTAGVFMVVRLSPLFEQAPFALDVVVIIGAVTAFVGASIGLVQTDIKRGIAYSTMSQLGYMFVACGVSAYGAAMFHLLTHAFFKALLFLAAGSVIHALHGEQDMRRMGGLWRTMPLTYGLFLIGTLSLIGIPAFSGFYSKDAILAATFVSDRPAAMVAYGLTLFTVMITAFYSLRIVILTFHGEPASSHQVPHPVPAVMSVPCEYLAMGALFAGLLCEHAFVGAGRGQFWDSGIVVLPAHDSLAQIEGLPGLITWAPLAFGLLGMVFAWIVFSLRPGLAGVIARTFAPIDRLLVNKWYFDALYDRLFVRPLREAARVSSGVIDRSWIDGLGPRAFAAGTRFLAERAAHLETGYVFHYALAMVGGLAILIALEMWH